MFRRLSRLMWFINVEAPLTTTGIKLPSVLDILDDPILEISTRTEKFEEDAVKG